MIERTDFLGPFLSLRVCTRRARREVKKIAKLVRNLFTLEIIFSWSGFCVLFLYISSKSCVLCIIEKLARPWSLGSKSILLYQRKIRVIACSISPSTSATKNEMPKKC